MIRLGTAQLDLLAHHRTAALDVLLAASAAYDGRARLRETPAGAALIAQPPDRLVSVAVSAVAAVVESRRRRREREAGPEYVDVEAADAFAAELLAVLRRRRLPFRRRDVELLLDLGASTLDRERPSVLSVEALSFAVSAAESLLRVEGAAASLLEALERAGDAIDRVGPTPRSRASEIRARIRSLGAAQVPGGLLDLVVVDPRDAWAEPARELLRTHAERWDGLQGFLALVARARAPRPTRTWRRQAAAAAAAYDGLGDLLRGLLEPLLRIDLSTSGVPRPPAWLLAPENEVLVKGVVWATASVDAPWVVPLLGRLTLRGAAPSPHPTVTTAQSLPVAGAAVETLAEIGSPHAMRELRTLLEELRRRDLLRRIAVIVREPAPETRARDERIRREKRRAVKLRSDPGPQERQRRATTAVRRSLAPLLRDAGFTDSSGRTFWRVLDDRVETAHCRAGGDGLALVLGIRFSFVPRAPSVAPAGHPRPHERACDLRATVRVHGDDLEAAGVRVLAWFDRWRPLAAVLRWLLIGTQSEEAYAQGGRGTTEHALLTGYVARQAGEEAVARRQLGQAAVALRGSLGDLRSEGDAQALETWVSRVEADAAR